MALCRQMLPRLAPSVRAATCKSQFPLCGVAGGPCLCGWEARPQIFVAFWRPSLSAED